MVATPGPEMIVSEVTDSPMRVLVSGGPDEVQSPQNVQNSEREPEN